MANKLKDRWLTAVPDLVPTGRDLYVQRVTEVVADDHAGRPEAAATAQTAAMLANLFAAARSETHQE
jgi:hypothetical protein